jgi:hypothetical protein
VGFVASIISVGGFFSILFINDEIVSSLGPIPLIGDMYPLRI